MSFYPVYLLSWPSLLSPRARTYAAAIFRILIPPAAVKRYIVEKYGVPAEKIVTEGYGESRPVADNGNFQGRQRNRRVEFKVWR
ncbi:MAG: OmpA family protein [Calothrix sp. SM1_5_4]|nr:OmpA family protein [Calothrix sp. SM1_5_4]